MPVDLAAYSRKDLSPGYVSFTTLISNGMGAGLDIGWALGHGLMELLQRDGNGLLFRALDQGVVLERPSAPTPGAALALDAFAAAGVQVTPKFATDEWGLCKPLLRRARDGGTPPRDADHAHRLRRGLPPPIATGRWRRR